MSLIARRNRMRAFILGIWTPLHDLDAGVLEHGAEQAGELAVAIPDQEPRPAPGILKIHDEVLRGFCVLDDRQHIQTGAGYGDGFE